MNSGRNELAHVHQFSTYFGAKKRAAHVAAHTPLTCRSRTAHTAAHIAAHVVPSERPEIVFTAPIHMIAHPQNIAPQKRSWRFLIKMSDPMNLRKNLLKIDHSSVAQFSLFEDFPGDFHNEHRRMYMHAGDRPVILALCNGLDLRAIVGQGVVAKPQWVQASSQFSCVDDLGKQQNRITIYRIVRNAPKDVKSLSRILNTTSRRTP